MSIYKAINNYPLFTKFRMTWALYYSLQKIPFIPLTVFAIEINFIVAQMIVTHTDPAVKAHCKHFQTLK